MTEQNSKGWEDKRKIERALPMRSDCVEICGMLNRFSNIFLVLYESMITYVSTQPKNKHTQLKNVSITSKRQHETGKQTNEEKKKTFLYALRCQT